MMERRNYPRFVLKVDAKYTVMDSEEVYKRARTTNISAEGVCIESDRKLDIGTYVKMEVDLGDTAGLVTLVGEIRWRSEIKTPDMDKVKYMHGIKLVDIDKRDEGRFLKFYCDRMVEKLSNYLKME